MTAPAPARPDQQESLLRLLFDQAPGFMAVLDGPQHTFTLANAAYDRLVGHRELIGRTVAEAFPEVIDQGFIDMLDGVLATGEPHVGKRVPLMLLQPPGAVAVLRHVDFVYQPMHDASGRVGGVFVQGQDVTDHVEVARRIDEQSRAFDGMLSSLDDFVYTFDRQHRFTYANKGLLDLLGIGLDEIVGKTFFELPYPAPLARLLSEQIEQVFQSRERVRGETVYESPGGQNGWYEYILSPVFSAGGVLATVAGATRDITSRIQQERRLAALAVSERMARASAEAAGRAKDDFLATLSHELRTPLNAILGWSELLRSGRVSAEQTGEAAERITRNARAQARLIADLLDVNGIASGKVRLAIERVPLARVVTAALDTVRPDALARQIELHRSSSDDAALIDCDPDRLQQVLWNLLANAVKFTPTDGTVSVDVSVDATTAIITVADTGAGLAAEFLPRLFERFSQADSSSTRRHGGLGLGLSICKSLVTLHGGRIEAHSDGVGLGATFTVTLPLQRPLAGEAPSPTHRDEGPDMTSSLPTVPLRFDPAFEHAENDEAKTTTELSEALLKIARKTFEDSGHAIRSVHAKNHGVVRGELQVLDGLPPTLAQGLFARPARYPAILRFSTTPGDILDDKVSTPRGLGLKVLGVGGERLPGSEGDTTQDFLLVDGPVFLVPNAKKFLGNLKLLAATTDRADGLKKVLSAVLRGTERAVEAFGGKSGTLIALGGHAPTHVLGASFYSQVPTLYGDYMAKLSVVPVSPGLVALVGKPVDLDDHPNGLRESVVAHFAQAGGEWEVRVQLCTDIEAMPIEDASVEWSEEASPYVAVARIVAPPQPAAHADDSELGDDRLAFSPWHGIAAHRPIGSIGRVRQAAYETSKQFRATSNGCPIHEPR